MLDLNSKPNLSQGQFAGKVKTFIQGDRFTKIVWETQTGEEFTQIMSDDEYLIRWFRCIADQHSKKLEDCGYNEILELAKKVNTNFTVTVDGRYDRVSID